jgi:hypothetical protein
VSLAKFSWVLPWADSRLVCTETLLQRCDGVKRDFRSASLTRATYFSLLFVTKTLVANQRTIQLALHLTPAFILETVAAAKQFLAPGHDVMPKDEDGRRRLRTAVKKFPDWPMDRVQNALAQLNAMDEGELSKKALESLPTIHAATPFIDKSRKQEPPVTSPLKEVRLR